MIDVMHRHPDGEHVAFRVLARPGRGTAMNPDMVVLLDGSSPREGEFVVCGSCGERVNGVDLVPVGGFA